jgi:hypothetical protein
VQRDIVTWIIDNFDGFREPSKRQNLNQGVYMTLTKFYDKVLYQGDDEKLKKNHWKVRLIPGLTIDNTAISIGEKRKSTVLKDSSPSKKVAT